MSRTLLSIGLAVALLAAILVVLLVPHGGPPPAAPTVATEAVQEASSLRSETSDVPPATLASRTEVATPTEAPKAELDPSVRAALAGFRGRVLHHDGTPVSGCGVKLLRLDADVLLGDVGDLLTSAQSPFAGLDAGRTTTADDGRFALDGVWPRAIYLLRAGIDTDDPTMIVVDHTPGPGETVDLGDIVLVDGAVVTGTVVNADGEPVAGARVWALQLPAIAMSFVPLQNFDPRGAVLVREGGTDLVLPMPSWVDQRMDDLPLPLTRSGDDGRFRLAGIEPGVQSIVVTDDGYMPVMHDGVQLSPGEEKDLGDVRMREGEEVYGVVVQKDGRPVAGAQVLVGRKQGVAPMAFARRASPTAEDGTFSVEGFTPGAVLAAARRADGEPWVMVGPTPIAEDLRIELPAVHDVVVQLQSAAAELGEPRFRLLPGEEGEEKLVLNRFGLDEAVDLDDRIETLEDRQWKIGAIPDGHYTLLVQVPGHALKSVELIVDRDVHQVITLTPAYGLSVQVLGPNRAPVAGAKVYRKSRHTDLPLLAGTTKADGTVHIDDLPDGRVEITAQHPAFGWSETDVQMPAERAELTFDEPATLQGEVLCDDPKEAGPWTVAITARHDQGANMPWLTVPDAEGKFTVVGVQPGEYDVSVLSSVRDLASFGAMSKQMADPFSRMMPRDTERVQLVAGQTAHVALHIGDGPEFDGAAGRVTGTVMIDGRPAAGMVIQGWSRVRLRAVIAENGSYDLPRVPAGQTWLGLSDPDQTFAMRQLWSGNVEVKENETAVLDISFDTGSVAGRVVGPDGQPLGAVVVRMNGRGTNGGGFAATDDGGRFRIERLPVGKYAASLETNDDGRVDLDQIVEVRAGLPNDNLVLRAQRTYSVSGTVDVSAVGAEVNVASMGLNLQRISEGQSGSREFVRVHDGAFEVKGLLPGQYRAQGWVRVGDEGKALEGTEPLVVNAGDMTGVVLRLRERKAQVQATEDK